MPIVFKCACGKSLRVDEKLLGKKVKCPGCGNAVLVAAPGSQTAVAPDKPKKPAAPAKGDVAAAKPRKPAPVPNDDEDDEEDTPPPPKKSKNVVASKPRKPAPDPDDEDSDEDTPPPPKKAKPAKGKSRVLLIGGICVGLLVCVLAAGGVWFFLQPPPSAPPIRPAAGAAKNDAGKQADPVAGGEIVSNDDLALIPDGSTGFVSVRPADIWKNQTVQDQLSKSPDKAKYDAFVGEMQALLAVGPDDIERVTIVFRVPDGPKTGPPSMAVIAKSSKKWDLQKLLDAAKTKGLTERKTETDGVAVHILEGPGAFAVHFPSETLVVSAENEKDLRDFLNRAKTPAKNEVIVEGIQLASTGKHQIVAACDINRKLLNEVPDDFWKQAPNLRDLKGVVAAGGLSDDVALEVNLLFPDEGKSEKAKKDVEGLRVLAGFALKGMAKAPASVTKLLDSLAIEQRAANVTVSGKLDVDLASLGTVLQSLGNNQRTTSINNLKQIGLAMHSFADVNKRLPKGAETPKDSKGPGLSWRVALLPYLEQGQLYNEIHHDEPFDSPHNKKLWDKMPTIYQLPGKPNDGKTYYQVFRGEQTIFPLDLKTAVNLVSIADGTSNTIMVVEAAKPVNWMAPDDIPFDAKKGGHLNQVGNHWGDNTFVAGLADGSVRTVRRQIPELTLRALITRNGGEADDFSKWVD